MRPQTIPRADARKDAAEGFLAELRTVEAVVAVLVEHASRCAQHDVINTLDRLEREAQT